MLRLLCPNALKCAVREGCSCAGCPGFGFGFQVSGFGGREGAGFVARARASELASKRASKRASERERERERQSEGESEREARRERTTAWEGLLCGSWGPHPSVAACPHLRWAEARSTAFARTRAYSTPTCSADQRASQCQSARRLLRKRCFSGKRWRGLAAPQSSSRRERRAAAQNLGAALLVFR